MDKIKFLKDVEIPNLTVKDLVIGSEHLSSKRLNSLLSLVASKFKTVYGKYEITVIETSGSITGVSFTANGEIFHSIHSRYDYDWANTNGDRWNLYYDDKYVGAYYFDSLYFDNTDYINIDFGETPQDLTTAEYDFLMGLVPKSVTFTISNTCDGTLTITKVI